jgi:LEA14-like dessication related protein
MKRRSREYSLCGIHILPKGVKTCVVCLRVNAEVRDYVKPHINNATRRMISERSTAKLQRERLARGALKMF